MFENAFPNFFSICLIHNCASYYMILKSEILFTVSNKTELGQLQFEL